MSHLGQIERVHPREAIADRIAGEHTVAPDDVRWFYGVCRRVEHETRLELEPYVEALRDVRKLLEQIVAHEGHDRVEHCVEDMIAAAKAALTVSDRVRYGGE